MSSNSGSLEDSRLTINLVAANSRKAISQLKPDTRRTSDHDFILALRVMDPNDASVLSRLSPDHRHIHIVLYNAIMTMAYSMSTWSNADKRDCHHPKTRGCTGVKCASFHTQKNCGPKKFLSLSFCCRFGE